MTTPEIIYLDNAATTPLLPAAADALARVAAENFGNPSSIHTVGRRAAAHLRQARQTLADSIHADPKEIILCDSGTEANNLALSHGIAALRAGQPHLLAADATAHASVRTTLHLAANAHPRQVVELPVDSDGQIRLDEFDARLRDDNSPALLSVLLANNETGIIQQTDALFALRHRHPHLRLHLDAVQSYLKHPLDARTMPFDYLTVAAHKIHGPKGAAFCYVRHGANVAPMHLGGAQERFRRAGTENLPAIATFAAAVAAAPQPDEYCRILDDLQRTFLAELRASGITFILNRPENPALALPGLLSLTFPGMANKEDLLIAADLQGLMISSTSACHSGVVADSHVLMAMGLPAAHRSATIRVAFSRLNTPQDATRAAQILAQCAGRITASPSQKSAV